MIGKAFCSIGLHRYTHVSEEWIYTCKLEYSAVGFQYFYKICRCGYRKEIERESVGRLPFVAAPVYSYTTP